MTVVIGTAGHIDHGKTSLLRALTGIDGDRLPEERRRGMTIDVGYAHLRLPDGAELDFVDVPGHERFLGNMLVGAGEIDAAMLVVAADDGPRAQTIEHLELLDALGIRDGLAVVTKADLAGPERTATVVEAVHGLLRRTTLAGIPVLVASSVSGVGVDEVGALLGLVRDRVEGRVPGGASASSSASASPGVRLAIDRVFSVKGRGVVVTGTLRGGRVEAGAPLRLEPSGRQVRVRAVQVHGIPVDAVEGGGRVALNVAGVELADMGRGDVLTNDPAVQSTDRLLVLVRPPVRFEDRTALPPWPPTPGAELRLHLGTQQVAATVGRGGRERAELPDGRWVLALRLATRSAVGVGDRFVLRVPSPGATAAGGVVLEVAPPVGTARRRQSAAALIDLASAFDAGDAPATRAARVALHGVLPRLNDRAGPTATARAVGEWLVTEQIATTVASESLALVDARHDAEPLAPGAPLAEVRRIVAQSFRRQASLTERTADLLAGAFLDQLVADGRIERAGQYLRDPARPASTLPPMVLAAMAQLEAALSVAAPPSLAEAARIAGCPAQGIRELEASGRIVRVEDDLAWAATTHRELEALALRLASPGPLTPAALRDASGTSRKYVMALLEDLDRRGILRRTPEGHVLGPRAPQATP